MNSPLGGEKAENQNNLSFPFKIFRTQILDLTKSSFLALIFFQTKNLYGLTLWQDIRLRIASIVNSSHVSHSRLKIKVQGLLAEAKHIKKHSITTPNINFCSLNTKLGCKKGM